MVYLCETSDLYRRPLANVYEDFLKLARGEAHDEGGVRTKSDEEDLELWAHIDSEQSSHRERGLFGMWLSKVAELGEETTAGRHWVLQNIPELQPGECWAYHSTQKWENDEICFSRYNDLCDEMEMAEDMDDFSEEMEQHRLCREMGCDTPPWERGVSEWTIPLSCRIESVGKKFWVGRTTNGSGMIYIPSDIIPYHIYRLGGGGRWGPDGAAENLKDISLSVEASFKGFEGCRGTVLEPWKANYISRE
jgi:hypothetical protein